MADCQLKQRILNEMKALMKAKDKERLSVIRLMQAALKQKEVDERIELDDSAVLAILDKMVKQRKESIKQYKIANRQDLVDQEKFELEVIHTFLPAALDPETVNAMVMEAIVETGATEMKDMGRVMAILKPKLQGKADMAEVSKFIKDKLI